MRWGTGRRPGPGEKSGGAGARLSDSGRAACVLILFLETGARRRGGDEARGVVGWVHARVLSELGGSVGAQERAGGAPPGGERAASPGSPGLASVGGPPFGERSVDGTRPKIAPDLGEGGRGGGSVSGAGGEGVGGNGGAARRRARAGVERWGRPSGRARVANVLGARAREVGGKRRAPDGIDLLRASALLTSGMAPARVEARALRLGCARRERSASPRPRSAGFCRRPLAARHSRSRATAASHAPIGACPR